MVFLIWFSSKRVLLQINNFIFNSYTSVGEPSEVESARKSWNKLEIKEAIQAIS